MKGASAGRSGAQEYRLVVWAQRNAAGRMSVRATRQGLLARVRTGSQWRAIITTYLNTSVNPFCLLNYTFIALIKDTLLSSAEFPPIPSIKQSRLYTTCKHDCTMCRHTGSVICDCGRR